MVLGPGSNGASGYQHLKQMSLSMYRQHVVYAFRVNRKSRAVYLPRIGLRFCTISLLRKAWGQCIGLSTEYEVHLVFVPCRKSHKQAIPLPYLPNDANATPHQFIRHYNLHTLRSVHCGSSWSARLTAVASNTT